MGEYKIAADAYLSITCILSVIVPIHILWKYSNRKVFPYRTYITSFVQYFCAMWMILIIPLDLAITITSRRSLERKEYYDDNFKTIESIYITLYWVTIICNLLMIFDEEYIGNGFFTCVSKIRNTCKQLSVKTFILCVLVTVFFGILIGTKSVETNSTAIFLTSVLLTNTVWMGFLVLLLGYGLVMFPRDMWKKGNFEQRLLRIQYEIAQEFINVTKSYSEIFLCLANIQKTKDELSKNKNYDAKLMEYIMILIEDSPVDINCPEIGNVIINRQYNDITVGSLANYRGILYQNNTIFTMAQGKLNKLQMKAYFLEDLIEATGTTGELDSQIIGYPHINWSFKPKGSHMEYTWYIHIKPILYKVAGILCGILSMCSYLSIVGMIDQVPFYVFPYFVIVHDNTISQIMIGMFAFVSIGYLCYVARWALFEINLFKSLELIGNKVTWPIPLSTNSRLFASLAAPLAFFFLGMLHENGIGDDKFKQGVNNTQINTVFSTFYKMNEIPLIGSSFNVFFPIMILCVSVLTCAKVLNTLLKSVHCDKLQFNQYEFSSDALEEGKAKLSKRKKLIKKAYRKMIQHNDRKDDESYLNMFFKGFIQQSKFHCDMFIEDGDGDDDQDQEQDQDENDIEKGNIHNILHQPSAMNNVMDISGSLSLTDPDQLNMELVGRRITMLGSVFRMYSTKVVPSGNDNENDDKNDTGD